MRAQPNQLALYDCTEEAHLSVSSYAKGHSPHLLLYNELIDLKPNKAINHQTLAFEELDRLEYEAERCNLYKRIDLFNFQTYWESRGTHPHELTFAFKSGLRVQKVEVWVDKLKDPSYCPQTIAILVQRYFNPFMPIQLLTIDDAEEVYYSNQLVLAKYTFILTKQARIPITAIKLQVLANLEFGVESRIYCVRIWSPTR